MMKILRQLWHDESGVIVTTDLILLATILVIGTIVGLTTMRDQIVQELADVSVGIASLNQSYSFAAVTLTLGTSTFTAAGSSFTDAADDCDQAGVSGGSSACISISVAAAPESS